ncbi:MAG: hypothetical protein WCS27_18315, partial [Victivallaceae bacterium]
VIMKKSMVAILVSVYLLLSKYKGKADLVQIGFEYPAFLKYFVIIKQLLNRERGLFRNAETRP